MKVSDYIVKMAHEAGITDVFMVTGGGAMHLDDSFGKSPLMHCTFNHNEQACAMAAEAYARVDNRPACVLVTTGPGATNAITGVLCAWMESIPMLVISGQARYATTVRSTGLPLRSMGVQEYDITKSTEALTKYSVMITDKKDVRYTVEKALYLMSHGRRGPVWLDVPLDVQAADIAPDEQNGFDPAAEGFADPAAISDEDIERILAKLKEAKRPILFGGYGVRASGSISEFRRLAELLGCPVLGGMSSVDLFPEDHPLYAGRTGMTGNRAGNFAAAGCDLYVSIGSRLSFLQTGFNYKEWARGAYVILNDLDENEFKKPNVRADMQVIGDAAELIRKLTEALLERGADPLHPWCEHAGEWAGRCRERRLKYPVVTEAMKGPQSDGLANIYAFYDRLSDILPDGAQVIGAVGTSRVVGTQVFRCREHQRFYANSATASMGYDLPCAIGISVGSGRGEVSCVTGDGSIMMNLQEMQTIATNRLPVRVFLICNGGYHSIRQTQNSFFGKPLIGIGPESGDLEFPDPGKTADLFGFGYSLCASNETLEEDLRKAMQVPLPALIEVRVSPLQKTEPKVSSRRLPDGNMVSLPLEDMAPFLDRDELARNVEVPLTESELAQ